MHWTDVEGWLSRAEGESLRMMALGKRVLEFGSWKGRSTIAMAQVAVSIAAVDHHEGDSHTGPADTADEFLANIEEYGVEPKVDWWACTIEEFDSCHDEEDRYDLVFCDAEHTEAATFAALEVAKRRVKPGGIIAWHDADYSEVRAAVDRAGLSPLAGVDRLEWTTWK